MLCALCHDYFQNSNHSHEFEKNILLFDLFQEYISLKMFAVLEKSKRVRIFVEETLKKPMLKARMYKYGKAQQNLFFFESKSNHQKYI